MTKKEAIDKVKNIIDAPSCCPKLKTECEEYLASLGTEKESETAKALIAELEASVMPIDAVIDFFSSPAGIAKVGAETAEKLAAHAKEVKEQGGKYCDCPACTPGKAVLDNRDVIL